MFSQNISWEWGGMSEVGLEVWEMRRCFVYCHIINISTLSGTRCKYTWKVIAFCSLYFQDIFLFFEVWLIYSASCIQQVYNVSGIYICVCVYIYILFQIIFHFRLLQDIEYISLCYTAGLCCSSILHNSIYLLIPNPNLSHAQPFPLW